MSNKRGSIVFTDIKNSSRLWNKNPKAMFKALEIHDNYFQETVKKHKGLVVKTIGDSFMIYFPQLEDCVVFCLEVLTKFIYRPIVVDDIFIRVRIGSAYGNLKTKELKIQNCCLKDFFGNTVNTASRLESKVSTTNSLSIAFLHTKGQDMPVKIKKIIKDNGFLFKSVMKNNKVSVNKRSSSLLASECILEEKEDELKGIGKVKVWIIEPSVKEFR